MEQLLIDTHDAISRALYKILIPPLTNLAFDYYWYHPPRSLSQLPFDKMNDLDALLDEEDRLCGNANEDECYEFVTPAHIGRIGYTFWLCAGAAGPPFVIVWVHPSGKMFGVVNIDPFTFDGKTFCFHFNVERMRTSSSGPNYARVKL